ncbi:TM104 protein, partial [Leptocoma aspasia]|nr:TM104 protein [Leptocoma aspasia]
SRQHSRSSWVLSPSSMFGRVSCLGVIPTSWKFLILTAYAQQTLDNLCFYLREKGISFRLSTLSFIIYLHLFSLVFLYGKMCCIGNPQSNLSSTSVSGKCRAVITSIPLPALEPVSRSLTKLLEQDFLQKAKPTKPSINLELLVFPILLFGFQALFFSGGFKSMVAIDCSLKRLAYLAGFFPSHFFNPDHVGTTSLSLSPAFILMIILALIRISKGQAEGHPSMAQLSGIRNLFGVCVYSFMCQHSLPSLITPISKKKHVNKLVLLDYILILAFYSLLSFTAIYCFRNNTLMDMYTLNFTNCEVISVAFIQYFLGLFPVFTISTNFPIIAVTLRNNWKTLFHREGGTYPWVVDRIVFPAITLIPPVLVAFCTHDLESLVGITGAYAGNGIQYLIPAFLAYCSRKDTQLVFGSGTVNKHLSPFRHSFWIVFVLIWGFSCFVFVTANIVLSESKL